MGWWNSGADGSSLHFEDTGLIWGDQPADIIDTALDSIAECFAQVHGRPPTKDEVRAGLEFSLGGINGEDIVFDLKDSGATRRIRRGPLDLR